MNCVAESDSHSVCSSRPTAIAASAVVNRPPKVKKRRFGRFNSIRELFYASPFMATHRRFTRNKSRPTPEDYARSDSNLSTQTSSGDRGIVDGPGAVQSERLFQVKSNRPGSSGQVHGDYIVHLNPTSASLSQSSSDVDTNSVSSQTLLKPGENVSDDVSSGVQVECPLCLDEFPPNSFPRMTSCSHRSCLNCLQQYMRIEITESRVNISCPECTEPVHPTDIRAILNDVNIMNKYEDFMLRRVLATDPDTRWCPAPDCSYAVVASGCASCPRLQCERPGCHMFFCYHCKQEWHPNQTCDAARAQRSPNIRASSVSFGQDSAQRDDIKPCPRCQVLIVKMDDGSCNHMTCAICGAEFCWLCMKEISDLHYLSPSGCTFWGKKPWSRKKKILWQLGTLVGAPVGIGLVAGIAVPAIIIGVPVWVGRKLHARYEHSSKHKRNLVITGGVTASILISPVLASLAVGIGVPILLAYVYGVVPISLCRSGGCGVSTSSAGVRIEFDDENDFSTGGVGQTHDAQSVDISNHRMGDPSIGEMSFGMSASLSMGSGSHLDRMGVVIRDSDRESASNTAIASASLAGSIAGGCAAGHRLEVQTDATSNKRFSFSSETASATVSLSERSTTMSVTDDASTRALAGSITGGSNSREPSTGFTPVEVHVDANVSPVGGSQESFLDAATTISSSAAGRGQDSAAASNGTTLEDRLDCYSMRGTSFKERHRYTSSDRQATTSNLESESCSLWSREDSNSERVRFDEHVNFIDDLPTSSSSGGDGEFQLARSSEASLDLWRHQPISKRRLVSSSSTAEVTVADAMSGGASTGCRSSSCRSTGSRKHSLTWMNVDEVIGVPARRTSSVSTWHGQIEDEKRSCSSAFQLQQQQTRESVVSSPSSSASVMLSDTEY